MNWLKVIRNLCRKVLFKVLDYFVSQIDRSSGIAECINIYVISVLRDHFYIYFVIYYCISWKRYYKLKRCSRYYKQNFCKNLLATLHTLYEHYSPLREILTIVITYTETYNIRI